MQEPRPKNYSAETGYVYRYWLEFKRTDLEYTFRVAGRGFERDVSVTLVSAQWEGRTLTVPELQAVANMALRLALDAAPTPAAVPPAFTPDAAQLSEIGIALDL